MNSPRRGPPRFPHAASRARDTVFRGRVAAGRRPCRATACRGQRPSRDGPAHRGSPRCALCSSGRALRGCGPVEGGHQGASPAGRATVDEAGPRASRRGTRAQEAAPGRRLAAWRAAGVAGGHRGRCRTVARGRAGGQVTGRPVRVAAAGACARPAGARPRRRASAIPRPRGLPIHRRRKSRSVDRQDRTAWMSDHGTCGPVGVAKPSAVFSIDRLDSPLAHRLYSEVTWPSTVGCLTSTEAVDGGRASGSTPPTSTGTTGRPHRPGGARGAPTVTAGRRAPGMPPTGGIPTPMKERQ